MRGMTASTVLVTGATSGIGLHIVRQFAELGWTVLVGARDMDRGAEVAAQVGGRPLLLDVTDADTIARAAATVPALDVLVNNAGISLDIGDSVTDTDVDVFRRTYETNVFGVVAVTNAFLPALRRSAHPRIVFAGHEPQSASRGRRRPGRSGGGRHPARTAAGRWPHRPAVLVGRDGRAMVKHVAAHGEGSAPPLERRRPRIERVGRYDGLLGSRRAAMCCMALRSAGMSSVRRRKSLPSIAIASANAPVSVRDCARAARCSRNRPRYPRSAKGPLPLDQPVDRTAARKFAISGPSTGPPSGPPVSWVTIANAICPS
jgi:short chain dehydrogenase